MAALATSNPPAILADRWRRLFSLCRLACGIGTALLLSGCATQVVPAEDEGGPRRLQFQQSTLAPRDGERGIEKTDLQAGDILLTADDKNWISAGIRLVSLSPVSHAAMYVGYGHIVEAIHSGVQLRRLDEMRDEQSVIAVYRYPGLDEEQREKLRRIALRHVGERYNFVGVALQAPFMLTRRFCEVPVFSGETRNRCYHALGVVQMAQLDPQGLFCSQFVLETFRQAGIPLTDAASHWISPDDIMHMREGDVASFKATLALEYAGHLKMRAPLNPWNDPETGQTLFVTRQP